MSSKPTYEELEQKVQELEEKAYKQKLVEEELLKTEDIHRQLAQNIREVLIINSPGKDKTIYVNPAYEELWGMSCTSLYENPKSFLDAIHPQDRERVIKTFDQQKEGKSVEVEYRILRADGRVTWVNARTWTAYNVLENIQLSFVAIRDITRRKQVEEELERANEELEQKIEKGVAEIKQYKHITETMNNPIGMVDRNFIYCYANEPYSQALNRPIREIIGHSVPELFGQNLFETVMENHYKRCFSGETVNYQAWFDLPGWGRRYLDVCYYPFREANGQITATIINVHDITEIMNRLQFENKLSELSSEFINLPSEKLDSKMIDALAWIGPFMRADRSHIFRFNWDRTEFRITHLWEAEGIKKDDVVFPGLIVKDAFPWLFENMIGGRDVIVPDIEILSTPETSNEYQYCREIGIQSFIILPIHVKDAPLCAIGLDSIRQKREWPREVRDRLRIIGEIFTNTIARRHAEMKSEADALRYRTVADFTYDWEYWQHPDGSFHYVSPSCERICGYTPQDFIKNPSLFQDIIAPEDRAVWDEHRCSIQMEMKPSEIQFRIQKPDGGIRWIEHACQPVFDLQGNNQGVRASNRDITKRKLYKSETHQLQSELAHMDRIVTINTLTSALAHEINQPLAAMRSYAQAALRFMGKDQPDYDSARKALQGIVSDNKRAAAVVNRLRDLVKKGTTHWEALEINSIINDVVGLINSEIMLRNASIKLDLHPIVPVVHGDPVQIQQVLINLLTNALDALEDQPVEARTITISTKPENSNGTIISISDSGEGIPPDKIQVVFDTFHTTKPDGMGLGLAICKSIIEAHGGKIWVENNLDGDTIFSLLLPASNQIK